MPHKPTDEQQAVIDRSHDGEDLKVMAFAGTGKTSTLIHIASAMPRKRMLYLAFNKATQMEAQASFPKNVECRTAHSLAFRSHGLPMKDRLNKRLWAKDLAMDRDYPPTADHNPVVVAAAVLDTLKRFEGSADDRVGQQHVPRLYLAAIPDDRANDKDYFKADVVRHAQRLWDDTIAPGSQMPARHDTYLKLWQLSRPRLGHQVIMFDEAQDASPVMSAIVAGQQEAQRIFVGDTHQQIYAWRGAVNAMEALAIPELALTQSFRFGPEVAEVANDILSLKGNEYALRGFDALATRVRRLDRQENPRTVLCRSNAGIIGRAVALIGHRQSVHVVGGVDDLVRQIQATYDLWRNAPHRRSHPLITPFKQWQEFVDASKTEDGADLLPLVRIADNYGSDMPDVARQLGQCSKSERGVDAVLSTAHKAKGREWAKVEIADDFGDLISNEGKPAGSGEINLAYVAATRAQGVLDIEGSSGFQAMYLNADLLAQATKTTATEAPIEAPSPEKESQSAPAPGTQGTLAF